MCKLYTDIYVSFLKQSDAFVFIGMAIYKLSSISQHMHGIVTHVPLI